jgi:hypothetical protein
MSNGTETQSFASIRYLRELIQASLSPYGLVFPLAPHFRIAVRYQEIVECEQIAQSSNVLRGGVSSGKSPEWEIGFAQIMIPLRNLFDTEPLLCISEGAPPYSQNDFPGWSALPFVKLLETLESQGVRVLVEAIHMPVRKAGPKNREELIGVVYVVWDRCAPGASIIEAELKMFKDWVGRFQAWMKESYKLWNETRYGKKSGALPRWCDWRGDNQPPECRLDNNQVLRSLAYISSISRLRVAPPKTYGHIDTAFSDWRRRWLDWPAIEKLWCLLEDNAAGAA